MSEFDKGTVYKSVFSPSGQEQTKDFHTMFTTVLEILASATRQEKRNDGHLDWKNTSKHI